MVPVTALVSTTVVPSITNFSCAPSANPATVSLISSMVCAVSTALIALSLNSFTAVPGASAKARVPVVAVSVGASLTGVMVMASVPAGAVTPFSMPSCTLKAKLSDT